MLKSVLIALCFFLAATADRRSHAAEASGRNIYVNPETGDDRSTGLVAEKRGADGPVKTIHRAIRMAVAGDTIHLARLAMPYHETPVFHNVHGEPGKPITFDGHGATITGAEPLAAADCQEVAPGLFRADKLIPAKLLTPDDAVSRRWFFLYAGKINRMGRTLKGKSVPYKKLEELAPDEWTYVRDENAFYLKLDPKTKLADAKIEYPARSAGVQVSGSCAHLAIRNLITTHVYNDGYNIHGKTRDVRYENIQAIECGDDGFSAHDECDSVVDGFVSLRNATGIANAGTCTTETRRMFADGNVGTDVLFLGSGRHILADSHVRCTAAYSLRLWGQAPGDAVCTLELNNVLLERAGDTSPMMVGRGGVLEIERSTLLGLSLDSSGNAISVHDSAIGGEPGPDWSIPAATRWTADHNLYDLRLLRIGSTSYDQPVFQTYQSIVGQDRNSRWTGFKYPPGGADARAWPLTGVGCEPQKIPAAPGK